MHLAHNTGSRIIKEMKIIITILDDFTWEDHGCFLFLIQSWALKKNSSLEI